MPKYLLDTSYIIAHLAPDEDSTEIDKVFEEFYLGKIKLYVLPLTFYEVANYLQSDYILETYVLVRDFYVISL